MSLNPSLVTLLRAHRTQQKRTRVLLGPGYQDRDLVFASAIGTPLDPMNLYKAFVRACKAAKVRRIPFHGLRHTHATLLLARNVNAKIVSERLGHAGVAITMDTYSHVLPDMQDVAARQIEDLFHGTKPAEPAAIRPGM